MTGEGPRALRLNVGCGDHYAAGWVNLDLACDEHRHPDVTGDARSLPFRDATFDRCYLGRVLEHVARADAHRVLLEARRVLRPGGLVTVVGPALDRCSTPEQRLGVMLGAGRWPGDEHQWTPTTLETVRLVERAFPGARLVSIEEVGREWPVVSRAAWRCAVQAEKTETERLMR